jgi:hypothetical protein
MVAKNDEKARCLDLVTSVLELARDGKRDYKEVSRILQEIKDNPDYLGKFFLQDKTLKAQIESWEKFYKEIFNIKKDFSNLKIPEQKEGFDWLIIVAEGMTPNRIFSKIKELMSARKYADNLDIIQSVRKADYDYAIIVRDRVEADEELKNKSANQLQVENINSITLEERLLLEIKYFKETGKHLDINNYTLCAGSRHPDGGVPRVSWCGGYGRLEVRWYSASGADERLRSREVVS